MTFLQTDRECVLIDKDLSTNNELEQEPYNGGCPVDHVTPGNMDAFVTIRDMHYGYSEIRILEKYQKEYFLQSAFCRNGNRHRLDGVHVRFDAFFLIQIIKFK